MQQNPSLGPMEETSLDFENLVLGKKTAPSSTAPPVAVYQHQTLQQGFINPRPSTPMAVLTPTPPPPSSSSFFQPLQSSSYTASLSSAGSTRNDIFSSPSTAFSASSNPSSGFSASNTLWSSNNNASLNFSLPTIAPPPSKPNAGFPPHAKPAAAGANSNGLEKYQSLL